MRLAPSRTRELSWSEGEESALFVCPSTCVSLPCYSFRFGQTDKCKRLTNTCTWSTSPPPSSHIWLAFFLVCFCHSLGCVCLFVFFGLGKFLVSSYKSVKPAPLTTVLPSFSLSQRFPFPGVWSKEVFLSNKAPPVGFRTGRRREFPLGEGVLSDPSALCSCVFYCVHTSKLRLSTTRKPSLKNALVSI